MDTRDRESAPEAQQIQGAGAEVTKGHPKQPTAAGIGWGGVCVVGGCLAEGVGGWVSSFTCYCIIGGRNILFSNLLSNLLPLYGVKQRLWGFFIYEGSVVCLWAPLNLGLAMECNMLIYSREKNETTKQQESTPVCRECM